jgi:hypothetical protein
MKGNKIIATRGVDSQLFSGRTEMKISAKEMKLLEKIKLYLWHQSNKHLRTSRYSLFKKTLKCIEWH